MSEETCAMFRQGETCGSAAKWTVLTPMSPVSPVGGYERPACGRHLQQALMVAAERTTPGELIEVRQLAGEVQSNG